METTESDIIQGEEVAKDGSVALAASMASVENGMKELVQHLENQFGDDSTAEMASPVPNDEDDNAEDEGGGDEEEEGDGEEDDSPSPQDVFTSKLFSLIARIQLKNEERLDDWENDDDAGYLTITLSEPEFIDFEEVK